MEWHDLADSVKLQVSDWSRLPLGHTAVSACVTPRWGPSQVNHALRLARGVPELRKCVYVWGVGRARGARCCQVTPFLEVRSDRQVWVDLWAVRRSVLSSTPHKSVALCMMCGSLYV